MKIETNPMTVTPEKKTVTFHPYVIITEITSHDADATQSWYSREEIQTMRLKKLSESLRLMNIVETYLSQHSFIEVIEYLHRNIPNFRGLESYIFHKNLRRKRIVEATLKLQEHCNLFLKHAKSKSMDHIKDLEESTQICIRNLYRNETELSTYEARVLAMYDATDLKPEQTIWTAPLGANTVLTEDLLPTVSADEEIKSSHNPKHVHTSFEDEPESPTRARSRIFLSRLFNSCSAFPFILTATSSQSFINSKRQRVEVE